MTIERKLISVQSRWLLHSIVAAIVLYLTLPLSAADLFRYHFLGSTVYSYFEFPGPSDGSRTFVYIVGNLNVVKQTGGNTQPLSTVTATYIVYDGLSETNPYPVIATGSVQFPGSSGLFFSPGLQTAHIDASLVIKDQTGAPITVAIDAEYAAVGEFGSKNLMHYVGPNIVIHSNSKGGINYNTTPSGTITIGETALTPETTYDLGPQDRQSSLLLICLEGTAVISKSLATNKIRFALA